MGGGGWGNALYWLWTTENEFKKVQCKGGRGKRVYNTMPRGETEKKTVV
jgi:hypothetical protein